MADAGGDVELEAFRAEARAWLEQNFPPSLKGNAGLVLIEGKVTDPDALLWKKRMGEKGWGTPMWPKEYGGGGLSAAQTQVLRHEMQRIGAFNPMGADMGYTMVGPTILDYGT